jgi:hypothetical protein
VLVVWGVSIQHLRCTPCISVDLTHYSVIDIVMLFLDACEASDMTNIRVQAQVGREILGLISSSTPLTQGGKKLRQKKLVWQL